MTQHQSGWLLVEKIFIWLGTITDIVLTKHHDLSS
jgi:hypothetical protein